MKKKIGFSIVLGIIISIVLGMQHFVQARVVSNDPTVLSGGTIQITLTVTEPVSCFKVKLIDDGGLTFASASLGSSFSSMGIVNNEERIINAALLQGTGTTLGTYTFTAPVTTEDKTYTVKFEITGTDNGQNQTNTSTVTVKGTGTNAGSDTGNNAGGNTGGSTDNGSGGNDNNTTTAPAHNFRDVNDTVYAKESVRVRNAPVDGAVLGQLQEGEAVARTGIGDNGWDRVSYKGHTAYVSKDYLTTTPPTTTTPEPEQPEEPKNEVIEEPEQEEPEEDITEEPVDTIAANVALTGITIQEGTLTPSFQKDVTEYKLQVAEEVTELHIQATAEDANSEIEIVGNTNLKIGSNNVRITVTAEDGSSKTYVIRVTRQGESGLALSTLKITALDMEIPLQNGVYEYAFQLESEKLLKEIEFTAVANESGARVEITGNKNLKEGENVIHITVTSKDGTMETSYTITVANLLKAGATTGIQMDITTAVVVGTVLLTAFIIGALFVWKFVGDKKQKEEEQDEDIPVEEMQAIEVNAKAHSFQEIEDMDTDDDIHIEESVDKEPEEEYPRKRRGKHF